MLRCAQTLRVNVVPMYASARRFFARLASGSFEACKSFFQQSASVALLMRRQFEEQYAG